MLLPNAIADLRATVAAACPATGPVLPFGIEALDTQITGGGLAENALHEVSAATPTLIHVICQRIIDHTDLLREVGSMSFPHRPSRGDGATHAGAPDRGDPGWKPAPRDLYWPPFDGGADPEQVVRVKTRDFR